MAALGVHQHAVDGQRVALPLEPRPLRPAGDVGAVAALQHQALDAGGAGAGAQRRRDPPSAAKGTSGERSMRCRRGPRVPRFQPRAALVEGQRAQILAPVEQHVVEAHVRRIARLQHRRRHGLAVEPLLQVVERRDAPSAHAPAARRRARRRSRAPRRCRERRARDVVAGAREEPPLPPAADAAARGCRPISTRRAKWAGSSASSVRLVDADAPASAAGRRRRRRRCRRRRRALPASRTADGRAAARPCQTSSISSTPTPPYCASAVLASRAETPTRSAAGQQLQQRPAAGGIERVEPALRAAAGACACGARQASRPPRDRLGRRWRLARAGQISAAVSARSPT